MNTIALLTDFGVRDEYVGVVKGVILSINPQAFIVDITHHIDPGDIEGAAHILDSARRYFPKDTIFIVVVDPGVGGTRSVIAVKTRDHLFTAPDNGVLSKIPRKEIERVVRVENTDFFLKPVSRTFHGRDIFAPVGANLSLGVTVTDLGSLIDPEEMIRLNILEAHVDPDGSVVGSVIVADRFGNLITDIDEALLTIDITEYFISFSLFPKKVSEMTELRLMESYDAVPSGRALLIIGSRGTLEIAVNGGSAAAHFGAGKGYTVTVLPKSK